MGSVSHACVVLATLGLLACERSSPAPPAPASVHSTDSGLSAMQLPLPAMTVLPPPASTLSATSREAFMKYEEKFTPVERQLIELPHSSDAILSRAMRGEAFPSPPGAEGAIQQSDAQEMFTFNKPFAVPNTVRRVAFPDEGGGVDVVRLRYRAGRYVLTVSHSRNVLAVAVRGYRAEKDESPLAVANRAAEDLFAPDVPRRFERLSGPDTDPDGSPAFGCQIEDPDVATMRRHADWKDCLCWWTRPDEVGFITLKLRSSKYGHGSGFTSPQVRENANWFKR